MKSLSTSSELPDSLVETGTVNVQFPANSNILLCEQKLDNEYESGLESLARQAGRSLHMR